MQTSRELAPAKCPRCGRDAWFYYTTQAEAAKQTPLCWGYSESDCSGFDGDRKEVPKDDAHG